jgi:hypothetical protein
VAPIEAGFRPFDSRGRTVGEAIAEAAREPAPTGSPDDHQG